MASDNLARLRKNAKPRGQQKKPCHYCGASAEVSISMRISEGSQYNRNLKWLASKQVRACATCATNHLARFA